jgi:hypothetical protein
VARCGPSNVWRGGGQYQDDCQDLYQGWGAWIFPGESVYCLSKYWYLTVIMVQHLMFVTLLDGRRSPLTLGTFTVTKIVAWDVEGGVV